MGILDELRSTASKFTNRNASPDTNGWRVPNNFGIVAAVTKIGDAVRSKGAQKLKEYVPESDSREKIGRIMTNIGKFAVDSAVNESFKGVKGGIQVNKIVKEGLKDQPPSQASDGNNKPDVTLMMEVMEAKMEKMQEDMNNIKQQNKIPTQCAKGSEPLKELPTEPIKGSAPLKTEVKKIMIRSRL